MGQPKYKVGDTAYVVDQASYPVNNVTQDIPLGTAVKIRTVSMLRSRGFGEIRYEVHWNGGPLICWVNEGCLSPRILDIACAA